MVLFMDHVTNKEILGILSNEKQYDLFTSQFPNGMIFLLDFDLRIRFAGGQELARFNGRESFPEKSRLPDLMPFCNRDNFVAFLSEVKETGTLVIETCLADQFYQVTGSCLGTVSDPNARLLLVFQNISDVVNVRDQLRFDAAILRDVSDAIIVKNLQGIIHYWNDAAVRMFGYTAKEMIGCSISRILSGNAKDLEIFENVKERLLKEGSFTEVFDLFRADGITIAVEVRQSLMYNAEGQPTNIICLSRDISHQIEADRYLKESEANLQAMFQSTSQSFMLMDSDFRILTFNKNGYELLRNFYGRVPVKGGLLTDYFLPGRAEIFSEYIKKVINGEVIRFEQKYDFPNKNEVYLELTFSPVITDGQFKGIILCAEDKTDIITSKHNLIKSEAKYKALVESSMDLIWTIDSEGKICFVNRAIFSMLGYEVEEVIGKQYISLVPAEERDRVMTDMRDALSYGVPQLNYPNRALHKDGRILDLITHAIVHFEEDGDKLHGYITATSRDITERMKEERSLSEKNMQLKMLSSYLQTIREDERGHIAREIHDELGQQLTGIKMDLSWVYKKLEPSENEVKTKLTGLIELVNETVKTIRRISSDLRPPILDNLGLLAAIEWQCQELERRSGVSCVLVKTVDDLTIPDEIAMGVFRIVQEAFTNISRHSQATEVGVEIAGGPSRWRITISDNGVGFTKSIRGEIKTLGLIGMQERASMIGGTIRIDTHPGRGTELHLEFPTQLTKNIAL